MFRVRGGGLIQESPRKKVSTWPIFRDTRVRVKAGLPYVCPNIFSDNQQNCCQRHVCKKFHAPPMHGRVQAPSAIPKLDRNILKNYNVASFQLHREMNCNKGHFIKLLGGKTTSSRVWFQRRMGAFRNWTSKIWLSSLASWRKSLALEVYARSLPCRPTGVFPYHTISKKK